MTLNQIINIAARGYPMGRQLILSAYKAEKTGDCVRDEGDSLAVFIVRELIGIYFEEASREEQLKGAINAMKAVLYDIEGVIHELEKEVYDSSL